MSVQFGKPDEIPKDEWDLEIAACADVVQRETPVRISAEERAAWQLKRDKIALKAAAAPNAHGGDDAHGGHDAHIVQDAHGRQNGHGAHDGDQQRERHFSAQSGGSGRMLKLMPWAAADADEAGKRFAMGSVVAKGGASSPTQQQQRQKQMGAGADWKKGLWQSLSQAWTGGGQRQQQSQQQRGARARGVPMMGMGGRGGALGGFGMLRGAH